MMKASMPSMRMTPAAAPRLTSDLNNGRIVIAEGSKLNTETMENGNIRFSVVPE